MKSSRFPFKKIVFFQTYLCVVFLILVTIVSLFGAIKATPIYNFDDYFGQQNLNDDISKAVTEDFNIGMIDVITGIPQLVEAIQFNDEDVFDFDLYGYSIGEYLEQQKNSEKQVVIYGGEYQSLQLLTRF